MKTQQFGSKFAKYTIGRYRTYEGACKHCKNTVYLDTDGNGRTEQFDPSGSVHNCKRMRALQELFGPETH